MQPLGSQAGDAMKKLTIFALLFLFFGAASGQASVNDLVAFLDRAEQMYTPHRIVRADIELVGEGDDARHYVLVLDPTSGQQLIYGREDGSRSVTAMAWGDEAENGRLDTPAPGSDLRPMEWFPFWKTDYAGAFISDENRTEKTVSLYAEDGRPYMLFVVSFDKTKLVPTLVKYYTGSLSNLIRIRTDSDHVVVGARPRPTKILVQDYSENTTREYRLTWSELDAAPADLSAWKPE